MNSLSGIHRMNSDAHDAQRRLVRAKELALTLAGQLSDFDRNEVLAGRFTPAVISFADREGAPRGALFAALVTQLTQEHA